MKRHMLLLPLVLFMMFLISTLIYIKKPAFSFSLKTISGDIHQADDMTYTMTLADGTMRWDVQGKGENLQYRASFLNEKEVLHRTYESYSDGFYLYVPHLMPGQKKTDYELEQSKDVKDIRFKDLIQAEFYNINEADMDLFVHTDKGYACFFSGLHRSFAHPRGNVVYLPKDDQLYFQSNPYKAGIQQGHWMRHPYVKLQDKTLVTLYSTKGSTGSYRVFEVEEALQSDRMPSVAAAKKATRVREFLTFDAQVSVVSDMIGYGDQLYVAVQKQGVNWIQIYDSNGAFIKEWKMKDQEVFHYFDVQDDRLLLLTTYKDKSYLRIYTHDQQQPMEIVSAFRLSDSIVKLQGNKTYILAMDQAENEVQHMLNIGIYEGSLLVFSGNIEGDYEDDVLAHAYYAKLQSYEVIPKIEVRDMIAYGFRE